MGVQRGDTLYRPSTNHVGHLMFTGGVHVDTDIFTATGGIRLLRGQRARSC